MEEETVNADPMDDESSLDGCEVEVDAEDTTADEDLPITEGGVA
jgi:hypothetical protein